MRLDSTDQFTANEPQSPISYRMVNRRYYCYICQKEYTEMVNALAQLTCSHCHEGFVEIVEKKKSQAAKTPDVDEEKKRANEQYRIRFDERGQRGIQNIEGTGEVPLVASIDINRTDLYDRSTQNLYG